MVFERKTRIGKVIVFDVCTQAERGSQLEPEHETQPLKNKQHSRQTCHFCSKRFSHASYSSCTPVTRLTLRISGRSHLNRYSPDLRNPPNSVMASSKTMKFKVAAAHAAPVFMNKDGTIKKVIALIERAGKEDIKLLVFPETFVPGYPVRVTWAGMCGMQVSRLKI
jgi:hypothetical protein